MSAMLSYLLELRTRILRYCLVWLVVFIILAFFAKEIYQFLALPLMAAMPQGGSLIATAVATPFLVPFKSALVCSFFITVPYFFYQLWGFVAPALYKREKHLMWGLLCTSTILFYIGVLFAYLIVLPIVFKFFIYIAPAGVEVKPDINEYFSFIVRLFVAFGLAFELPVAIVLLVFSEFVTVQSLSAKRPYVIVGAFIVGMLLTPPDVISQILLAVPIWLLFELGLLLAKFCVVKLSSTYPG